MSFAANLRIAAAIFGCLLIRGAAAADYAADHPAVFVAAAANFIPVLGDLDNAFSETDPGAAVLASTGASGNLFAQIRGGAPFDVFLSADLNYPRQLARSGAADASTLRVFARGRLVLWTVSPTLRLESVPAIVRNPAVRKLAIANPRTAPYGRAARQALEKLGLYAEAAPKLVTGENISQTAHFVYTGNADAGFVALSLVLSPGMAGKGRWLEVPPALYDPLDHAAIITAHGRTNAAARAYVAFLASPAAREILKRYGYAIPTP